MEIQTPEEFYQYMTENDIEYINLAHYHTPYFINKSNKTDIIEIVNDHFDIKKLEELLKDKYIEIDYLDRIFLRKDAIRKGVKNTEINICGKELFLSIPNPVNQFRFDIAVSSMATDDIESLFKVYDEIDPKVRLKCYAKELKKAEWELEDANQYYQRIQSKISKLNDNDRLVVEMLKTEKI